MKGMLLAILISAIVVFAGFAQKKFQSDVFKTSGGELKITFIGHGTLMLNYAGKVIHADPVSMYADYATLPKADLILITHEHGDHLDMKAIQAVSTANTAIVVNPASAKTVVNGIVMKNGDTKTVSNVSIEAVPAYNLGKPFHPKGNGNGYILTLGDMRVYIAGDTENVPEIKALKNIDVAFLPMNQPYTMTPEQVADVAKAIRPKILYPYHFSDTVTGKVVDLLKDEKGIEVRIRDLQ
ncbi:MAG: MBL fold metallo-hydrolase [Acidobacteria bacterium]|nr:MBL fold metallo-hydrolase [Acidobacteriota bacterium]